MADILLQGHLYVTHNYIGFHSNVFGYVTKVGTKEQSNHFPDNNRLSSPDQTSDELSDCDNQGEDGKNNPQRSGSLL